MFCGICLIFWNSVIKNGFKFGLICFCLNLVVDNDCFIGVCVFWGESEIWFGMLLLVISMDMLDEDCFCFFEEGFCMVGFCLL